MGNNFVEITLSDGYKCRMSDSDIEHVLDIFDAGYGTGYKQNTVNHKIVSVAIIDSRADLRAYWDKTDGIISVDKIGAMYDSADGSNSADVLNTRDIEKMSGVYSTCYGRKYFIAERNEDISIVPDNYFYIGIYRFIE